MSLKKGWGWIGAMSGHAGKIDMGRERWGGIVCAYLPCHDA